MRAPTSRRMAAGLLIVMALPPVCARADDVRLDLKPCELPGARDARCGRLAVPVEPGATATLELRLVVLPAREGAKAPDPVFFLHGGPGAAATDTAPLFARSGLRGRRDIVLVDQRGTGGSSPLDCRLEDLETLLYMVAHLDLPDNAACRRRLPEDLGHFTTRHAADDLDAVRQALGAERINLLGGSYGTRVALEYVRRHGDRVRTATLRGVAPPSYSLPARFDGDSAGALDGVLDDCTADRACRDAFPDLRARLDAVLERLEGRPATARIRDPYRDREAAVPVDRALFAAALHYALYTSAGAARIPWFIDAAGRGDFDELLDATVEFSRAVAGQMSLGAFLTVACAEDAPFLDVEAIGRGARDTLLRGGLARSLARACEGWGVAPVPASFKEPVRSPVPVLLLSGEHDPVTPPAIAAEAARHLPRSVHLVLPETGHSNLTPGCTRRILEEFIAAGSMDGIDTSCVDRIRRRRFDLPSR